jgi:metal-dependent amidase/aminoacylase/carboxypeptidase family protein
MPLIQEETLGEIFEENAKTIIGEEFICHGIDMAGSRDMGDLSLKIPSIQPILGGITGKAHGEDYMITDKESVYIAPAKLMACTVYDLLKNKAEKALKIMNGFKPID